MFKTLKHFFYVLPLIGLLVLPYFVFADNATLKTLESVGSTNGGYKTATETSAAEFVGTIISAFLSILGVIFLILMLYSGYNWMIAHGDEQKVNKAKETLRTSIIGLIIVVSSYAIYYFIWDKIIAS